LRALVLLGILLVSTAWFNPASNAHAANGAEIPTEGGTWTNPTITTVITPASNMPSFKASYSYDVNHAIARWAKSIITYTDAYSSYYLRKLNFNTCISGINESLCSTPDIRVQFIQSFGSQSAGLGITSVQIQKNSGIFVAPTTTTLAAYDPTNTTQLTDTDMINIASHEFGHALGLNHATLSVTDDGTFELMFLSYGQAVGNPRNSLEAPSTLDMYALSNVYDWLANPSGFSGTGHSAAVYSLPPGIAYTSVYPYSEQIQTLQNSINQLRLEILIVAVVAGILLAVALALGILLARKKPSQPPPFFGEPFAPPPAVQTASRPGRDSTL
jgi:hypothetical protein